MNHSFPTRRSSVLPPLPVGSVADVPAKARGLKGDNGLADAKLTAAQEFRRHWKMVLAAAIGFSFTSVMTSATGLFIAPISREFGWSRALARSEEHTSALQSLMRTSYAVFCL